MGNQAFYLDNQYLFSGDSIFLSSIARPDLGGQAKSWTVLHYESLKRLLKLPDDTVVLPAHFSTLKEAGADRRFSRLLKELKRENEGLIMAGKSLEEFSGYILKNLPEFPKQYIDIKRVNIGLLQPNEEQAEELEIGKNICAVNKSRSKMEEKVLGYIRACLPDAYHQSEAGDESP